MFRQQNTELLLRNIYSSGSSCQGESTADYGGRCSRQVPGLRGEGGCQRSSGALRFHSLRGGGVADPPSATAAGAAVRERHDQGGERAAYERCRVSCVRRSRCVHNCEIWFPLEGLLRTRYHIYEALSPPIYRITYHMYTCIDVAVLSCEGVQKCNNLSCFRFCARGCKRRHSAAGRSRQPNYFTWIISFFSCILQAQTRPICDLSNFKTNA